MTSPQLLTHGSMATVLPEARDFGIFGLPTKATTTRSSRKIVLLQRTKVSKLLEVLEGEANSRCIRGHS